MKIRFGRNALGVCIVCVGLSVAGTAIYGRSAVSSFPVTAKLPLEIEPDPYDVVYGDDSAPDTVLVLVSPTCVHCARWATDVLPGLLRGPVARGALRVLVRDYDHDSLALTASALVRCLPPGRREAAHEALFARRSAWIDGDLPDMVRATGTSEEDGRNAEECIPAAKLGIVSSVAAATREFGLRGTPTFVSGRSMVTGEMDQVALMEFVSKSRFVQSSLR